MIVDKIENINKYDVIPDYANEFINGLSSGIPLGRVKLQGSDFANVETYTTKPHDKCLFEAHKKYADIQILLKGVERLDYSENEANVVEPYDEKRDIAFFKADATEKVILDGTNFVLLMPNELHRPQMCLTSPEQVKKVVVKVRIQD